MNYKALYEKQKELINVLSAYSTHVVIMWNNDLNDAESKDLKFRLWGKIKKIKAKLTALESEEEWVCNNFRDNPFSENLYKCLNCGKMKSEHNNRKK